MTATMADFWEDAGAWNNTQQIPHDFTHPSALITITQACSLFSGHLDKYEMKEEKTTEPLQHMVSERSSSSVSPLGSCLRAEVLRRGGDGLRSPARLCRGHWLCRGLRTTALGPVTLKKLTSADRHGIFLLLSEYITSHALTPHCLHLYFPH